MTREEAMEILTHNWTRVDNPNYSESELDEAFFMAIEALSADRPHGEWIPCSEKLPKKGEVVLITNGKGNVRCGQYRNEHDVRGETHYWWWKGNTVESVIAWTPLPTPYKGGDDE